MQRRLPTTDRNADMDQSVLLPLCGYELGKRLKLILNERPHRRVIAFLLPPR
jgi:hypothetical protein